MLSISVVKYCKTQLHHLAYLILRKVVPGVVSTEVNAKLSFNTEKTLAKARKIIKMYDEVGIKKERVLVKIAGTWEGIQAAKM